ncbi:amidohydrolase family protein [Chitinophaga pendula]|uniref:amidohydrolase family protein n=1 Tax=Chitinophaga TaxID=79328 RepID=UPI000BB08AB6|nr:MULTISPECIES: amidohydrolase family protein [Chitinophaga]ASZ14481.1 amidohydrolase [Chitinophaga sp. MD30]UCJ07862.1 amidohydrolase family protein [Chitinophaga pendula]
MKTYLLLAGVLVTLPVIAQNQKALSTSDATYITHVNLVNVHTGRTDQDQTIVITDQRISAVGPAGKIKPPANAKVIDATGQYAMPGMTDAHIHFFQSGGLYTRPDALNLNAFTPYQEDQQWIKAHLDNTLARYLATGITQVIDVGGPLSNFSIRARTDTMVAAPTTWVTGPLVSTYLPPNLDEKDPPIIKVNTPDEARELVRKQLPFKPDFIKIWYVVRTGQQPEDMLPLITAAIAESHANGLKVAVHATTYVTAKLAVTAGADILVHSVDDQPLDNDLLQLLKDKKVLYIPTLIVMQNYHRVFTQQFNFSAHEFTYADPFMLGSLMDLQHLDSTRITLNYKKVRNKFIVPSKSDSIMLSNLKRVQDAGILIAAGTDAGNIGTHHAASFLPELLAMRQAGLSNREVIRAATINAAKGFGKDKNYGSIEKGKIADILLLPKDPADDLSVLGNITSVIHRGRFFQPTSLIPVTPEILAQQQLNAYNAHDVEAFLAPYSDSVEIYNQTTQKLLMKGKEEMRKGYDQFFKRNPQVHCQVINRIVVGNTVVDQERLTGISQVVNAGAIYIIENKKIRKVYFF